MSWYRKSHGCPWRNFLSAGLGVGGWRGGTPWLYCTGWHQLQRGFWARWWIWLDYPKWFLSSSRLQLNLQIESRNVTCLNLSVLSGSEFFSAVSVYRDAQNKEIRQTFYNKRSLDPTHTSITDFTAAGCKCILIFIRPAMYLKIEIFGMGGVRPHLSHFIFENWNTIAVSNHLSLSHLGL